MAIRSGTGGLKYPLVNQAELVAQQSAASASAGGSASASAYSANRQYAGTRFRAIADLQNSAAERQFRGEQAYYDRENQMGSQLSAQQAMAERQAAAQATDLQLQQNQQQFQTGLAQQQREAVQSQNQGNFDQQTAATEAQIQAGRLQLPPAAQAELDKLEESRLRAQELDNGQLAEFEQQYRTKKAGILSLATPTQSRQEAFDQSIVTHNGQQGQLDAHGQFHAIENPQQEAQQKQAEAQAEAQRKAAEQATAEQQKNQDRVHALLGKINPKTEKNYTPEEAQAVVDSISKAYAPPQAAAPAAVEGGPIPNFAPGQTPVQGGPIPNFAPGTTPVQGGPIPLAPTPQTFNMQPNGARIESANRADIYGAPPPQPMPPNESAQPVRPQPVAGTYSIPADATGGGGLQGNGARMDQANVINSPQAAQQRAELRGGPVQPNVPTALPTRQVAGPSASDFNQKWKTLPKGGSIVGPDGKLYVKK
jgi:hypothetical protein